MQTKTEDDSPEMYVHTAIGLETNKTKKKTANE